MDQPSRSGHHVEQSPRLLHGVDGAWTLPDRRLHRHQVDVPATQPSCARAGAGIERADGRAPRRSPVELPYRLSPPPRGADSPEATTAPEGAVPAEDERRGGSAYGWASGLTNVVAVPGEAGGAAFSNCGMSGENDLIA